MVLFSIFIYSPLAHMTWHPDGLLRNWGVLDFAGGTVVHMSAGIAALAGVAEVCVIKAFEVAMAVVIAPIHYSMMIWGTFYGFVVFGQLPDMWTVIGAAVIISTGLYTLRREYLISHGRI